jgi:hypothetical protein
VKETVEYLSKVILHLINGISKWYGAQLKPVKYLHLKKKLLLPSYVTFNIEDEVSLAILGSRPEGTKVKWSN